MYSNAAAVVKLVGRGVASPWLPVHEVDTWTQTDLENTKQVTEEKREIAEEERLRDGQNS